MQPRLPGDPTPIIRQLAESLRTHLTRHWRGELHDRNCRVGMWVDGHCSPLGAPCGGRCKIAREALAQAALALGEPLTTWLHVPDGVAPRKPRR